MSLLVGCPGVIAQSNDWALCGGPLVLPERPPLEVQPEPGEPPGTMHISADRGDLDESGASTLIDNVQVERDGAQMQSDRVVYRKAEGTIDAIGSVRLWKDDLYASGTSARLELDSDTASLTDVDYQVAQSHASGEARQFEIEGNAFFRVKDATYTTCNPDDSVWRLDSDFVRIDRIEEVGFARNVVVRFFDVPIFYTPVMTFPTGDKRKSGVLAPTFGVSSETGVDVTVPYYFNLAPDQDATIAARAMSDRGVLMQGEYRYLLPWGNGLIGGEFLPNDSKRDESRGAFHFEHSGSPAPSWSTSAQFDWVSDDQYFEDLGTNLSIASTQFLERRADVSYSGDGWYVVGRASGYQTVDPAIPATSRPYSRLPQFYFQTNDRSANREFDFDLYAEAVYFERSRTVTGARLDLEPSVSYPIRTAGTYIEPRLSLRHTTYALDNTAPGVNDSPSRTLPRFSTDAGMFLERPLEVGGRGFIHTLAPRAYFLYVPFTDQDDLPVFDTGQFSFNFSQLFRNDRFAGGDRMGDANQLSLALTSRLLDQRTGDELLRASIGQIRYFRDRRVQLPGVPVAKQNSSDLVADFSANINDDWRVGAGGQWDLDDGVTSKSVVNMRWQPDARRIVNAAYRFVRDASEQTDVSFRWPLGTNWGAVGRWNYALPEKQTVEAFLGFEYESCCWAFRAVGRRFLSDAGGGFNTGVFMQLELKGLAGIATGAANFLEQSIPGYRPGY